MKKILLIGICCISQTIDAQINCNNWLYSPSKPSYVSIGQLNVSGTQITVEAVINRTTPYAYGTGDGSEGDIVSKHNNPSDVNYLLRPNHAAITTTNGYFVTPDIADIELNKTYHIAMVYDGSTLKFYRNGCLMSQVAASGNLFQNSWETRIGYYQSQIWNTNFIGYINEVRIWNVSRTQDQLRAYMNTSLPNPTTQPGLLAYYTFDNLKNKQGNASWNGTLGGSAVINKTNPSCNPIPDLCKPASSNCTNWLKTPSAPSSVRIGQLNVSGNKVTVEAVINRTAPYSPSQLWAGDIVSKHREPTDVNYLLRPNTAEITTSNGYYKTPDIADIELNKTHHVAMVYDGSTLKFYRDGCLMSQIRASGNLVQNSWETSIGYFSPELDGNENFIGYINEVRIWNVARTQDELRAYMNSSLPNPTTQPGLLAYYTFDNLKNKQGNASWDGTINGSASINETNPACNFITNPCTVNNCNIQIQKTADTSICANSKLQLLAEGGTNYSWTPATGLSNPSIANPVVSPASSIKYFVTVSNPDGCSKADSVKITVNSLPVISKSNDTTVCVNSSVPLFAAGGTFYVWSPTATLSNSSIADPVASPRTSTIYTVKVTNGNGCSKTDSIKVGINPVALISKSNDTTICKNGSAKIFANGGNSYIWAPSSALDNSTSSSPVASPAATTVYHVNITDQYSCVYKDSIKVSVRPPATFSISPENSVCEKTQIQLLASGGDSYFWSPALFLNNRNINNPMVTPDSSITYFVFIKENTCNESATLSTRITVLPKPVVNATKSNEITCFLPSTQLSASGANQYIWSPSTGLDNPVMANPIASPPKTTVYTVTGKDMNGCTNSDTISIKVDFDKNIFYGLPNSFTPNEDGLNDCFGVSHWGVVSQLEFSIYNRFGQRIFYTNNPKVCWDGTFNGEPQNPDVYVYLIKATMTCGKIDKKGTVTLLR